MNKKWLKLTCARNQIQLPGTLNGGQSFRWKLYDGNWIGVFAGHVWVLQQSDDHLMYQVYGSEKSEDFYTNLLSNYFQLDLNLEQHFKEWSLKDTVFKKAATDFYGIRQLKQELVENIFSFICSSNNNITRISKMVEKLAKLYGKKICDLNDQTYYAFPEIDRLAEDDVESTLKSEGFGYRAKYISETAKHIHKNGGDKWLNELKMLKYDDARDRLMTLNGVGPKVADCICLMSLNHLEAVPVDTHVYQIAKKFYMHNLPNRKTVTTKIYKDIGDHFRGLYGPLAGWAQTVLFCADLKNI